MGEHATYAGSTVKIGTCENMYYLRAGQRHLIAGYDFGADVLAGIRFRFPFPDEDDQEPGTFGQDYDRGVRIPGWSLPGELSGDEHGSVQFTNREAGYVLSIPCPEGLEDDGESGMSVTFPDGYVSGPGRFGSSAGVSLGGLRVGRNGFNGYPVVRQQAFRGGVLVTLVSCGACGALHRLDTLEDAEPVIEAFRAEAVREEWRRVSSDWDAENGCWGDGPTNYGFERVHSDGGSFYLEMAARIMAGYFIRPDGSHLIAPAVSDAV